MLTIKRAAAATGIPEATLRAWERRYAVFSPTRTPAGYRLYDEPTLAALREMNELVLAGWAPRQAAAEVADRRERRHGVREDTAAVPGDADPHAWAEELIVAAGRIDPYRLSELLDEAFSRASAETVVGQWLLPALREVGSAWEAGEVSIAGEHLLSHAVLRRLCAAYEAAGSGRTGERVVVGLPAGARHELGALAFAVLARRAGANVLYLGPDLPGPEWLAAVERHDAAIAVVVVPTTRDLAAASEVVAALRDSCPRVRCRLGGSGAADAAAPELVLGDDLVVAARTLGS